MTRSQTGIAPRSLGRALSPGTRLLLFTLVVCGMNLGPCLKQVLGVSTLQLPAWQMYRGSNLDVCAVDVRQRSTGQAIAFSARPSKGKRRFPLSAVAKRNAKLQRRLERHCREQDGDVAFTVRCADEQAGFNTVITPASNACDGRNRIEAKRVSSEKAYPTRTAR